MKSPLVKSLSQIGVFFRVSQIIEAQALFEVIWYIIIIIIKIHIIISIIEMFIIIIVIKIYIFSL